MPRKGITVYLPRDLEARVTRIAHEQARSEFSVITEAVRRQLDKRADDPEPEALVKRFTSRMDARLDKAIGEALILKEVLLLFVRVWLEHNPPIEEGLEESAAASAEARFETFLDLVTQGLKPGGRSIADAVIAPPPDEGGGEDNEQT